MESLRITRERNALQTSLKDLKRTQVQELCRIHNISNTQRTKVSLESDLVEHLVLEHAGRVIQITKCDRGRTALGSSTSARPLVPQKRSTQQADLPPSKRTVGQIASEFVQNSVEESAEDVKEQLKELQNAVKSLNDKLSAPSSSQTNLTEEHVIAMIESRLSQQRQEFQQSLKDLQDLCESSFLNMQTSFDAVGDWKEEVTLTFAKIQDWAAEVEQKMMAGAASTSSTTTTHRLSTHSHLSSTPSSLSVSAWQTPAAPIIIAPTESRMRKSSRLSDGLDLSLATIPEQPSTPASEAKSQPHPTDAPSSQAQPVDSSPRPETLPDPIKPHKQVRISLPDQQDERCTPVASKTLFGTERSTEERFDDLDATDASECGPPILLSWPTGEQGSPGEELRGIWRKEAGNQ